MSDSSSTEGHGEGPHWSRRVCVECALFASFAAFALVPCRSTVFPVLLWKAPQTGGPRPRATSRQPVHARAGPVSQSGSSAQKKGGGTIDPKNKDAHVTQAGRFQTLHGRQQDRKRLSGPQKTAAEPPKTGVVEAKEGKKRAQEAGHKKQGQHKHTMSVILVSAGYDHTIRFWEALTGVCSRTIQHSDSQVNRLEITSDKKYLAAAGNPKINLYDIRSTNPSAVQTFEGHTNNVTSIAFQIDNRWMCSSSEDGTIKVWDIRSPSIQRNYKHNCPVNEVLIHPNQGELISCDQNGTVKIWDLGENKCTHQLIPEDDVSIQSISCASDGSMLIAGNNKGNCYVWEMQNSIEKTLLKPFHKFKSHSKYITRVLLSSDCKHVATCSADHTTRIWSTDDGFNLETTLKGHQRWVWDCAFSADSAYLVTACSDHYVRLWDLSSNETVRQYNGHNKGVICVALNDV